MIIKKRKMRTIEQARQEKREIKILDLLRYKRQKGGELTVIEKSELINLAKKYDKKNQYLRNEKDVPVAI